MEYIAALAPSTGLAVLFWLLMRAILRADRSERAMARQVREERRAAGVAAGVAGDVAGDAAGDAAAPQVAGSIKAAQAADSEQGEKNS